MTTIKSYVFDKTGYAEIGDYTGIPDDTEYIDGYIYLCIDNTVLLDVTHHDYVDQLWAYLGPVNGFPLEPDEPEG